MVKLVSCDWLRGPDIVETDQEAVLKPEEEEEEDKGNGEEDEEEEEEGGGQRLPL